MQTCLAPVLRLLPLLAVLLVAACGLAGPSKPVFQPLSLDLSGDMAPRDPSLAGTDVYCMAGKGTAMLDRQWRAYKTTGFVLPGSGAPSNIRLDSAKGGMVSQMRGYYDAPGQRMVFCPVKSGPPDATVDCASLYALDEDLTVGIKRTFDVPQAIQGGEISCAHNQSALQPL